MFLCFDKAKTMCFTGFCGFVKPKGWLWLLVFVIGRLALAFGICYWKPGFGCCCLVAVLEGWLTGFGFWFLVFWLWLLLVVCYWKPGFGCCCLVVVLEGWFTGFG